MTGYSFDRFKSTYTKGIITTTIIIKSENYAHNPPTTKLICVIYSSTNGQRLE